MRVLYVSYDGLSDPLGATQVLPYVEGLCARGHEFVIVSFEKPGRIAAREQGLRTRLAPFPVRWIPLAYHQQPRLPATLFDVAHGVLRGLLAGERFDLVHARSYVAALMGDLVARATGVPLLFDMRGFWIDERIDAGGLDPRGPVHALLRRLERRLVTRADAIVVLSRRGIRAMRGWPCVTDAIAARLYHVPTCCDLERFRPAYLARRTARAPASPVFAYLGSVGPFHPADVHARWIAAAHRRWPDARFELLVSEGGEALDEHLRRAGVPEHTVRRRAVAPEDVPSALAGASVGFYYVPPTPSKVASAPTKLGELLAAGLPVVTGAGVGDVEEILGDGAGRVLPGAGPDAFVAAVASVLEQLGAEGGTLADRCRATAEGHFSLATGIEAYDEIYRAIARPSALRSIRTGAPST